MSEMARGSSFGPLRYFTAVPLQSPVMLAGLALVCGTGLFQMAFAGGRGQEAVSTLLFLQMFSASTGFAIPARRGHYDPLLTGGASRAAVVAGHFAMSVLPGAAAWAVLGAAERLLVGGASVWAPGSCVAFVCVSVGGWALTAGLPRLSGGVVWTVAFFMGLGWSSAWRQEILAVAVGGGSLESRAMVYLLNPLMLAGRALSQLDVQAVLPVVGVVLAAGACAWRWLTRLNVTLEAAQ